MIPSNFSPIPRAGFALEKLQAKEGVTSVAQRVNRIGLFALVTLASFLLLPWPLSMLAPAITGLILLRLDDCDEGRPTPEEPRPSVGGEKPWYDNVFNWLSLLNFAQANARRQREYVPLHDYAPPQLPSHFPAHFHRANTTVHARDLPPRRFEGQEDRVPVGQDGRRRFE